jgi:transcriptional regulator with XRE-family HTH domain
MSHPDTQTRNVHHGRNVKRFREMLGMKQEAFATELGEDWSQRRVSLLEQKEHIEDNILEEVGRVLKVPVDAIKSLDDDAAVNIISNTFSDFKDNSIANASYCTFNPIDKILELYDDKVTLLERLLESEKEKVRLLERLVKE